MKLALITGAGTGIGRALTLSLVELGISVIAIGRRVELLQEVQHYNSELIRIIQADVSKPSDREKIAAAISKNEVIHYLIHNAGVLSPVVPLSKIKLPDWRNTMEINVEAPLFLTQLLLPHLTDTRVLHISSGWAHFPAFGFGAYCTSKAALYMLYQQFKEEFKSEKIIFGSVRPGIVDTPMQGFAREIETDHLPNKNNFKDLQRNHHLVPAETCAAFLTWLLLKVSKDEFSKKEWSIYDKSHLPHWLGERYLPIPDFVQEEESDVKR